MPPEQRDLASKARISAKHPPILSTPLNVQLVHLPQNRKQVLASGSCAMLTRVADAGRIHVPAGDERSLRRQSGQTRADLTAEVPGPDVLVLAGRRADMVCREQLGIVLWITDDARESRPRGRLTHWETHFRML